MSTQPAPITLEAPNIFIARPRSSVCKHIFVFPKQPHYLSDVENGICTACNFHTHLASSTAFDDTRDCFFFVSFFPPAARPRWQVQECVYSGGGIWLPLAVPKLVAIVGLPAKQHKFTLNSGFRCFVKQKNRVRNWEKNTFLMPLIISQASGRLCLSKLWFPHLSAAHPFSPLDSVLSPQSASEISSWV